MAALLSCCVLLMVAMSCTTSQWSKPVATADRRSSTASDDWVPVASACPTCPKETETKVVARQAEPLLQPPPAYQPSAQSAYIQQTLSAQQREIQNHFNTQGLLPAFIQEPQQFYNQQQYLPQTGAASQQLVPPQFSQQQLSATQQQLSPQLSHQQPSVTGQLVSPQLSHQQVSKTRQLSSPQLSHQLPSATQQVASPQPSQQFPSATQQVVSPQLGHQFPSATQQVVSPQLSYQLPSATGELVSPQPSQQQASAAEEPVSPKLSHQLPTVTQQLTSPSPQLSHQQTSGTQQLVSPQLSHQQTLAAQQAVSPQVSHQQISTTQLSHQQPSAAQQPLSNQLTYRQAVPQRTRRPPTSTTTTPAPQEEVQLLYVPVQTLRQQHQAALLRQQQQLAQELQNLKPTPTTEQPTTTLEPYQPPLSVYMGPKGGHNVKISDVVKVLKEAKTISVLDTVGPDSPQVFVGPSNLHAPEGYAKFELPYLSALESNRVERKVGKPPFFVAPLSFKPPPGYSKIPFPAPHVGSVVVTNITENVIHEKDQPSKTYSLPAELPPINPELPSLVNSLQDQRGALLVPQKQAVTKFLEAVQQVGLETSTERYTRNKQSRQPYKDTEVTIKPERLPTKQTRHRFKQPTTQYKEETVTTVQPQYLEPVQQKTRIPTHSVQQAEIPTHQPPYPQQSHYNPVQEDISSRPGHAAFRNPTRHPQYQEAAVPEEEHTNSQAHVHKTNHSTPEESAFRTVIPATKSKYNLREESSMRPSFYFASEATVTAKQAAEELQYPPSEPVIITEQPKYINPQENIPTRQAQHPVPETSVQQKYTNILEEIPTRRPLYSEAYSMAPKYTTPQGISYRQTQHTVPESSARPSQYETVEDGAQRQPQYSDLQESVRGNPSKIVTNYEDISHRQRQYPVLEAASPENSKYAIPQEVIPQRQRQYSVLQAPTTQKSEHTVPQETIPREPEYPVEDVATPVKSQKYHTTQEIVLRSEGGDEKVSTIPRDEVSEHRPQYPVLDTDIPQKQSKHTVPQEEFPILQAQHQNTEAPLAAKQPSYVNRQEEIPSRVAQYAVPFDRSQSQTLAEPVATSITTAAPVRTATHRGRSRGRYRPSASSTTTPASRTRSPQARGRRPVTRTTSEAPQVPASAADQPNSFESSRQPSETSQAHRFETQRRDRTRSRGRSRSTTTTSTASPQYNSDLYQEELYASTASTQHSRTDTVTENLPNQYQAPSGQVTRTQFSNGQVGFTQLPSSQIPQSHSGQISKNQLSNSQVLYTQVPSVSNSDEPLTYTEIPNKQLSYAQVHNGQDALVQVRNRNEAQTQIPVAQVAHVQTPSYEVIYSQLPRGQTAHSQIQSGTLDETQLQNTQVVQNHISSGQVDQTQIPSGQGVNNQVPSGQVRSIQVLSNGQFPSSQAVPPQIPDDYYGQSVTSGDSKQLSNTEAVPLQQDGFLSHELAELAEDTTQRQHSTSNHIRQRTQSVSPIYQTTLVTQTLRGRGDSQIVTSDRSAQQLDGDVTQKPSFVRIRGRVRGRPRIIQQPDEEITTVSPELQTTTVARKHTNFLNRGSARRTPALTTTPTAETTTVLSDKVYTVRPSRRPQQVKTKLTTRGRIRRPTRPPPTTTTSTLTTASDHRLNEVRDVITTEPIPTTRQFHVALQPEHEPVQQDQQKRQQYQSIQRHREPVQQYQTIQHQVPVQQYQQDQHYQIVQPHQASVQQYQPDQNYQVPVQQYQPDEKYQSVERFRVTDQTSLPSEEQPQYDADDPERGEESQFTTRTLAANFNNAIPNVAKSSSTQLEVTTEVPVLTEEVESTTEALVPTTEAAPLMLTALPDLRTTTESSTVGHGRRRGNWVRVRVRPQQQQDIFETAESQNLATVAAGNQIPADSTFKQFTKSPGNWDVLETDSPNSSSSNGNFKDHDTTTQEGTGHQGFSFNSHSFPSGFMDVNITVDSETKSPSNQNAPTEQESLLDSPIIKGYYKNSDTIRKHVTQDSSVQVENLNKDPSGASDPSDNGYSSDEVATSKNVTNSASVQSDYTNVDDPSEEMSSAWLVPPSGLDDPWNQEGSSKHVAKPANSQDGNADEDISKKVNYSWQIPFSGLGDSWSQEDPSRVVTESAIIQRDDDENVTTVSAVEGQDPYSGSLSSLGYYGKPEQDSDKSLNWGGYEEWWTKNYANHRPYYTGEHLKLPEESQKVPDRTSIWNMDSFRDYEHSEDPADDEGRATNTSLMNNTNSISGSITVMSSLEDYPNYQIWDDIDEHHHGSKHSVKKADPQNVYNDKQVKTKDIISEPEGSSSQDILTAAPEDTTLGDDLPTTENPVETKQYSELSTEESDQNQIESTTLVHSNVSQTPSQSLTTQPTSTEFAVVPSSTEHMFRTDHTPEDENIVGTNNQSYSESQQTTSQTEPSSSTEPNALLNSKPNIERTDTGSLMARVLGTKTSTRISHETEICYRGRCIKTKTKDSDIDQFSTD